MISVIILAHNKLALTRRCLSALAEAVAPIEHEVVCVDNASTEDVTSLQDAAPAFRNFRFLRNGENLSFSIANNRAAAESRGDTLLFLNNDVIASRGSVQSLLAALHEEPMNGIVGARLLYPSRTIQHAGIVQMLWGYVSNYGAGAGSDDGRFQLQCERFAVTGAMAAMPRSLFDKVGRFDEHYRWGYEDVDLCLKVRAAGRRVLYVPQAESVHEESATLSSLRKPRDLNHNYETYRRRWGSDLAKNEKAYLDGLHHKGVKRVAMLGTGQAARGLTGVLCENGIETVAFTSSQGGGPDRLCERPVVPLESLSDLNFDRLVIASQYYFEFEESVRRFDPCGAPIFPAVA